MEFDNSNGINTAIGFVCGILGGCLDFFLRTNAPLIIFAMLQAVLTALLCGAAGVAGKEFFIFAKNNKFGKIILLLLINKIKRKKNIKNE